MKPETRNQKNHLAVQSEVTGVDRIRRLRMNNAHLYTRQLSDLLFVHFGGQQASEPSHQVPRSYGESLPPTRIIATIRPFQSLL